MTQDEAWRDHIEEGDIELSWKLAKAPKHPHWLLSTEGSLAILKGIGYGRKAAKEALAAQIERLTVKRDQWCHASTEQNDAMMAAAPGIEARQGGDNAVGSVHESPIAGGEAPE